MKTARALIIGGAFALIMVVGTPAAHAQYFGGNGYFNGNPYGGYTYNPYDPTGTVYDPGSGWNWPNFQTDPYNSQNSYGYGATPSYAAVPSYGYGSYGYTYPSTGYTYSDPNYYGGYGSTYGYSDPSYGYGYDNYGGYGDGAYSNYGYGGVNPVNYSYQVPGTNLLGDRLCMWESYGVSSCDFNPHQWVYDPYSGSWY